MIFYTRSCMHLADSINLPQGHLTIQEFKDGELSVKIHDDVRGKKVWVCSSTVAPAENILETLFLLDALQRSGASINVLFVYFGYARQDRMFPGEPISVEVICKCFQQFKLQEIHVIHIHNPGVCASWSLNNHIPFQFFNQCMQNIDLVVAPDQGATVLAKLVATQHNKPCAIITKMRPAKEQIEILEIPEDINGKNILIVDDMISTGSTMVKASEALSKKGAKKIWICATHGLFSGDALTRIEQSTIEKVFVTNTLKQDHQSAKLTVIDIRPFLRTLFT